MTRLDSAWCRMTAGIALLILFGVVAGLATPALAQVPAPVALGQPLPTLQLKDQHD